jgi:hypothetical protein
MAGFEAFSQAMGSVTNKVVGENGALAEESTGNPLVNTFNDMVRGVSDERVKESVNSMFSFYMRDGDIDILQKIFKLLFHERDCRGGKGEKHNFHRMFLYYYKVMPQIITTIVLEDFIGEFGYYKDYLQIWKLICSETYGKYEEYQDLIFAIATLLTERAIEDYNICINISDNEGDNDGDNDGDLENPSLCCKWGMPSEGSHFAKHCWTIRNGKKVNIVNYLAMLRYNSKNVKNILVEYRKNNSFVRSKLNIVERNMCSDNWKNIKFSTVSSRAMMNYRLALSNKDKKGKERCDSEDRRLCSENLKEFLVNNSHKLKGGQTHPHELICKMVRCRDEDDIDYQVLLAQYHSLRLTTAVDILKMMLIRYREGVSVASQMIRFICMADVSGSMEGQPMDVAVSLTIFFSDFSRYMINFLKDFSLLITKPIEEQKLNKNYQASSELRGLIDELEMDDILRAFHIEVAILNEKDYIHNQAISFTDRPTVINFSDDMSPPEKYRHMMREVGYSTNIEAAVKCLLDICVKNKIPASSIPNLMIITDGQFNQMDPGGCNWNTSHENIQRLFLKYGYKEIPTIIYWNVRGDTYGYQATSEKVGVQLLSGFSQSMVKSAIRGQIDEKKVETIIVDGVEQQVEISAITPWDTLVSTLDDERYNRIGDIVSAVLLETGEEPVLLE